MAQPLYPPAGPQSIGQVLDGAFRIFQVSLAKSLPLGLLAMLAGQLPNIYYLAIGKPMRRLGDDPIWWALDAIGIVMTLILWSAMLLRQRSVISGQATSMRGELLEALRRVPALVALFVLSLLIIGAGLVALAVPGIYFAVALTLAWPALMLERLGPVDAIRRSMHLVKGSWWHTSAVLAVAGVIAIVFNFVMIAFIAITLRLFGTNEVAMFTAAIVVVMIALFAVGVLFYGAILLALYGERRAGRPER